MVIMAKNDAFIIEAKTEEEANEVNMVVYRFERFSETKGAYIFVRRRDK